jgi:maltose O-acetyltransferase
VFKRWARNAFFPGWRLALLRGCGIGIGSDVYIADDLLIVEELTGDEAISIGDRVSIAPRVTLVTSSHPNNSRIRDFAPVGRGPVTIEADAWIGSGAIILPGVTIGRGAVVGAQSVVASDVPPLHVVAGQPARTIRVLTPPTTWT